MLQLHFRIKPTLQCLQLSLKSALIQVSSLRAKSQACPKPRFTEVKYNYHSIPTGPNGSIYATNPLTYSKLRPNNLCMIITLFSSEVGW